MAIKFTGAIWQTGDSYVLTIPKQYVKDGAIKLYQQYEISLKEVQA